MLKAHLEEARRRGAGVIAAGDLVDAMAGKYDPRAAKDELRAELLSGSYFDEIVTQLGEWVAPYAQNLIVLSEGNHETKLRDRHEISVIDRVADYVNAKTGANVQAGRYAGWVRLAFTSQRADRAAPVNETVTLNFHHGSRGGGINDMAELQQRAFECPDADILLAGHTHSLGKKWISKTRLTKGGKVYKSRTLLLRTGSYKDDFGAGTKGWAIERNHRSKVLGSWWVRFYYCPRSRSVQFDSTEAM